MTMNGESEVIPIRAGSCRQCGQCCRKLGWLHVRADDETLDWVRAHDPDIKTEPDEDEPGFYWVMLPYPCKQLVDLGDGKYGCKLHDSKPEICKKYPELTDEIKPGCGYEFVDVRFD